MTIYGNRKRRTNHWINDAVDFPFYSENSVLCIIFYIIDASRVFFGSVKPMLEISPLLLV